MEKYDLKARVANEELELYHTIISNHTDIVKIIDKLPVWVLILNNTRQTVYYNDKVFSDLNLSSPKQIIGLRPGELFKCIYSDLDVNGCGNSEFCKYCGALNAILKSFDGDKQKEECHLLIESNGIKEALDLEVTATPINIENKPLTLFVIQDISAANRKTYLERTFLHDIGNTVSAIITSTELIKEETDMEEKEELINMLIPSAYQLLDEIQAQSEIRKAENHDWDPNISTKSSYQLIQECINIAKNYIIDEDIALSFADKCKNFEVTTEVTLLKRVIINMLKNAIEASDGNEVIQVCCQQIDELSSIFSVKNNKFIPEHVMKQLFQRSFSTKGKGRGIGTYSMKILAENYLKGQINVQSDEEKGTIFSVIIPTVLKKKA